MSFVMYDLIFLVLFTLATVIFLYTHRKNLRRQGILYLYPTKIGIKIIDTTAKKFPKLLKKLEYFVVFSGYILMVTAVYLIGKISYTYITSPTLARDLGIPPLAPLVPYIDTLLKVNFLPPFYFTYWIIVIAIIAIPHEFAHGIFARLNKIKVHSTGFGFLGPFLAAFVEPDEKQTAKAKKFPQLAILAAGTFANVLMTILFMIVLWIFFFAAFQPSGVYFNTYSTEPVNISQIHSINGINVNSASQIPILLNDSIVMVTANNMNYFADSALLNDSLSKNLNVVYMYDNAPAFKSHLTGAISEIDGVHINSYDQLRTEISSKSPGQNVTIRTISEKGELKEFNLTLGNKNGYAFLGIGRIDTTQFRGNGILSTLSLSFYKLIDPMKYHAYIDGILYNSPLGDFSIFIYNLLWWIVLINISVAVMNMLPLGIFDGGRFFMLTIWGITGSKKAGEVAFKWSTRIFLIVITALMLKWALIFF